MINSFTGNNAYLSNFAATPFTFKGIFYPTAEHAFQAAKTTDLKLQKAIAALDTPGEAKKVGRTVQLRDDWEDAKVIIMYSIVQSKFIAYANLRNQLKNTGDQALVEGNYWHDQFWGDCYCDKHLDTTGQNKLGKILMLVRETPG